MLTVILRNPTNSVGLNCSKIVRTQCRFETSSSILFVRGFPLAGISRSPSSSVIICEGDHESSPLPVFFPAKRFWLSMAPSSYHLPWSLGSSSIWSFSSVLVHSLLSTLPSCYDREFLAWFFLPYIDVTLLCEYLLVSFKGLTCSLFNLGRTIPFFWFPLPSDSFLSIFHHSLSS